MRVHRAVGARWTDAHPTIGRGRGSGSGRGGVAAVFRGWALTPSDATAARSWRAPGRRGRGRPGRARRRPPPFRPAAGGGCRPPEDISHRYYGGRSARMAALFRGPRRLRRSARLRLGAPALRIATLTGISADSRRGVVRCRDIRGIGDVPVVEPIPARSTVPFREVGGDRGGGSHHLVGEALERGRHPAGDELVRRGLEHGYLQVVHDACPHCCLRVGRGPPATRRSFLCGNGRPTAQGPRGAVSIRSLPESLTRARVEAPSQTELGREIGIGRIDTRHPARVSLSRRSEEPMGRVSSQPLGKT